jgi:hypothetical protein
MHIIYEYVACLLAAAIVATLAVTVCAIFMFLSEGRGIMQRAGQQFILGGAWLLGTGLAAKPREP